MSSVSYDLLNVSGNLVLYRIAMDRNRIIQNFGKKKTVYYYFRQNFYAFQGGNIAKMTSHGFNNLYIVKGFNRKLKINIA